MITKTYTYISFTFSDSGFDYTKKFENDLAYFAETQQDVQLETYLEKLLLKQNLIVAEGINKIALFHTVFYDYQCNTEFSPAVVAMLNQLGATFCITAQRATEAVNLYDFIDKMRERPAMYLGEASITLLSAYIGGIYDGCIYNTTEEPPFAGFNDFLGSYYGKYSTAGWKNMILADNYGNETQALTAFFELLDEFRANEKKLDARAIVHKMLHYSLLDFRAENDHERQKQIADMLHNVPLQLGNKFGNYSFEYDEILQNIFDRANGNAYLHRWIKANFPETADFEYDLWHGNDGTCSITTCLLSSRTDKETLLDPCEKLQKRFFALSPDKANEAKNDFLEVLTAKEEGNKIIEKY
jgi:hypothetical protein